ncbi:myb-like protein X [Lucilia cuprina]|uniref:myb-like protein X n=1 Tax=Lucilia cuprina TaxID=7375 RepID=UPI001F0550A1|nr:myb-like protein X [Lucilia cuprina]
MLTILCTVLLVLSSSILLVECRSYNNGLIFYNLENHNTYLPPTISVSRGRGLAKFKYSARGSIWSTFGKPCDCEGPLCGCCVGIKVKQYNFDQKMCVNVSYVRPKDEIQMEVFLSDTATAKYGIAARNPSPLCVPIMMGIPMSMCVQMSNIAVQGDNLNMCMDFLVRLASTQLFEMHFQCMKVGLQGASWVGPDGQPVIPSNESKIKDRDSKESEEYYDEAEEENEIISKEKEEQKDAVVMSMKEEDLNKAEEEMDDNDVRDTIMDIVKEQEKEEEEVKDSSELMKENEIEGLSPVQDHNKVEEIVTNIMESINEGKDSDKYITMPIVVENEQPSESSNIESVQEESNVLSEPISLEAEESNMESIMETNALVEEGFQIKSPDKNEDNIKESNEITDKPLVEETESLKLEINDLKDSTVNNMEMEESNEITKDRESLQVMPSSTMKDELYLEDLFENSPEKDMHIENNVEQPEKDTNEIMKETNMQIEENIDKESNLETLEDNTEHISNDYEMGKIEKFDMLINNEGSEETTEISQIANEPNNSLENLQQPMETSTERLMAANLKPTMLQIQATTSETDSIDSIDNTLTTATIMTTTTTTTTTATKKPTTIDKNSAMAVTFIENTDDDDDKTKNKAEEDDDDEDNNDGDNSHENDSDYDDEEESEETEDETTEKGIQTNDAITNTIVMPTATALNHKESSVTTQKLPNTSNSNESNSNDETNENTKDEFEAIEEQEEEIADEVETESNEESENENDAEEEYDDEYEDYETTTVAVSDIKMNSANDTCCKSATPAGDINDMLAAATTNEQLNDNTNTAVMPQTNTVATQNNLQFVSHDNTIPISNSDNNMLNVESTTNKMSQITINPAAATIAVSSTTASSNSNNALPLPLARKLFAHHHQQQQQLQQQQQQHHHHHQQYHRHSRQQRQHYV